MLIPTVSAKEFERFGFKKCAGDYGKHGWLLSLCFQGNQNAFVSDKYLV